MSFQSIHQAGLAEIYQLWREAQPDLFWIDVRQPEEWAEGAIPGIRRIPLDQLSQALPDLDPNLSYVCVCRSGGRSGRACQMLSNAGFSQVINFDGGMLAWYQAGYPTELI